MRGVLVSGLLALMVLSPLSAMGQEQICGPRKAIVDELQTQHGEFRRSVGLQDNMVVVEVFASDAGTWTILFTKPTGISCFVAVGRAWENYVPEEVVAGTAL